MGRCKLFLINALVWLFAINNTAQAQVDFSLPDSVLGCIFMDSVNLQKYRYDDNNGLRTLSQTAIDYLRNTEYKGELAEMLSVRGVVEMREGNFEKAMPFFTETVKILFEINDTLEAASMYINIANTKIKLDSLKEGTEWIMKGIDIFERYNDSTYLAYCYNTMAKVLGNLNNQPEQLNYSYRAYKINGEKLDNRYSMQLARNLAMNLQKSGQLDSALALGQRVIDRSLEMDNKRSYIHMNLLFCRVYFLRDQYEEAASFAQEALRWEKDVMANQFYAEAYAFLGESLYELEQYEEALSALLKAEEYGKQDGSQRVKLTSAQRMYKVYAKLDEFEEAYNSLLNYEEVRDSLLQQRNIETVNELQTKYESEKKEQEIQEMAQQAKIQELKIRQRTIMGVAAALLGLFIAASVFLVSRQRILKKEQAATENRLLSLRMQLNPHFIFNALTAIQNYILGGKDVKQATRYLSNFAKVMRAFLEYNQEDQISLEKEIGALELYIGMQKMRFQDGFEHVVEIDPDIDPDEVMVPPMLVQPFVENAVEHGLRNLSNGVLTLAYHIYGEELEMTVTDNGHGRRNAGTNEEMKRYKKQSLATKITQERIDLLNSKLGSKKAYRFTISDLNEDGTGTVVTFKIPLIWA